MKYILRVILLFSFLLLCVTFHNWAADRVESHNVFLLIQILVPTMSLTVVYFIAKKHEASIDLHGPILLGSYAITVYVITSFNLIEYNSIAMTFELAVSVFFYLLYIGFLSIEFWPHFIARSLLYAVIRIHVGYHRVQNNESEILGAILLNVCGWTLAETIFYVQ